MANLGGGIKGAASGAAAGSAVLPGIGTAIGGILGGLGGLFGGSDDPKFAPQAADLVQTADGAQVGRAYDQQQRALAQQQAFVNAVQAQNGLGNQSQVYNQLQGVAQGTGPNPAMAALQQQTANNTANQAALMAGQRGAAANPALIARQAAMQGAANQQNAIGQAATLQAQQQLGAISAAGNMANQQAQQQQAALNAYNQSALQGQQNVLGAAGALNAANVGMQSNINTTATQGDINQSQLDAKREGGLLGGLGAAATALGPVFGGGGAPSTPMSDSFANSGPKLGDSLAASQPQGPSLLNASPAPKSYSLGAACSHGGEVHGPKSNVGRHMAGLPPAAVNRGLDMGAKMKEGGQVPGKAQVSGDSKKNDTVKALLSPGEIVIPRSVTQSKDPVNAAAKFVQAVLAKQNMKKSK